MIRIGQQTAMDTKAPQLAAQMERPSRSAPAPHPLDSETLLGSRGEVEIVHQGETYRLRRTRQGKLILTK